MLHRLLMTLLTVCLALPAAAMPVLACHHAATVSVAARAAEPQMPPPPQMHQDGHAQHQAQFGQAVPSGHSTPQDGPMAAQHECIGCIAPYANNGTLPLRRLIPMAQIRPALAARLVPSAAGPETPPPRT